MYISFFVSDKMCTVTKRGGYNKSKNIAKPFVLNNVDTKSTFRILQGYDLNSCITMMQKMLENKRTFKSGIQVDV
jgi:hypothetical protein